METYYGKSPLRNSANTLLFLDFRTNLNSLLSPLEGFPIRKPIGGPNTQTGFFPKYTRKIFAMNFEYN